jgi:hypothetical protein
VTHHEASPVPRRDTAVAVWRVVLVQHGEKGEGDDPGLTARGLERTAPGLIANGAPGGALTTLSIADAGRRATDVASTAHLLPPGRSGHRAE